MLERVVSNAAEVLEGEGWEDFQPTEPVYHI